MKVYECGLNNTAKHPNGIIISYLQRENKTFSSNKRNYFAKNDIKNMEFGVNNMVYTILTAVLSIGIVVCLVAKALLAMPSIKTLKTDDERRVEHG